MRLKEKKNQPKKDKKTPRNKTKKLKPKPKQAIKQEKPPNIKAKHYEEKCWFISLVSYRFHFPWTLFSYVLFPKVFSDAEKMGAILQHKDYQFSMHAL